MKSTRQTRRIYVVAAAAVVAVVLAASTGCSSASPRHIQAVDSSQDRVKFLYEEETAGGQIRRGVIECSLDDDDAQNFDDCRHLDVEYGE